MSGAASAIFGTRTSVSSAQPLALICVLARYDKGRHQSSNLDSNYLKKPPMGFDSLSRLDDGLDAIMNGPNEINAAIRRSAIAVILIPIIFHSA